MSGSHAASSLGGLRNEWHEGACQRRHQSVELDGWWGKHMRGSWLALETARNMARPGLGCPEAEALYTLLEKRSDSEFYTRDANAFPWLVARMRESIGAADAAFFANRAVCDYAEKHYIPAARLTGRALR